ncbi:respiratory burst oxidase homolog protein A-like [Silene latifolia]|uniref:respiratory burst oxidase homolog protein A-like n=1 Tax=Silene latifolia TaxID=37657 RepID=UPI003D76B340
MEDIKEDILLSFSLSSSSLYSSSSSSDHEIDSGTSLLSPPLLDEDGEDDHRLRFVDEEDGSIFLDEVEQRFNQVAVWDDHEALPTVDASHFGYCIGMQQNSEFADELLQALRGRTNLNMRINKRELYNYCRRLTNPSYDLTTRIFFNMCDRDMDGRITKNDLEKMILLSASTNSLSMQGEDAERFASLILQEVDTQEKGYIEFHQLKRLFKTVLTKGDTSTENELAKSRYQEHQEATTTMSMVEIIFRTYWRRAWIVTLWLTLCIGLFTWKFIQYKHRAAFQIMGYCLSAAKGAAETLKLNMALILLPVSRNLLTWLRRSPWVSSIVPFNDNINFHKLIAGGIVIGVILHGGTHLACDLPRISASNSFIFQRTFGNRFGNQQPSYLQVLCTTEVATGIAMVILMAIAFSLATKMPRRRSPSLPSPIRRVTGYNTFWYSHHLLIIVYILLIIHSMFLFLANNFVEKTTWMYLAVPVLIYAGERIYRSIRSETYEVDILEANMYPGKVLHLKLSKPTGFSYKSGMYIYIKCPHISPFEWHPFSLTSGPNDSYLSIHIRTLGDWSYHIHNLFQEAVISKPFNYPKVYIDGPYGAASQDHIKYEVVVMIGLGIGATPFISVLKDIGDRLQKQPPNQMNDLEFGDARGPLKAYFYWVTREHGSLDWFRDSMKEIIEASQTQRVIEMHNFLTSVNPLGDARSILLSTTQSLHFAKTGLDIFSRTQVRTHFSRPHWLKIFTSLAQSHEGSSIGVFYCGSSNLAKELEALCTKLSTKTTTRFVFHKENY